MDKTSGRILGFESREKPTGRNPLEGSEYVGGGLECQGLEDVTFKDVSYLKNALFFRSSKGFAIWKNFTQMIIKGKLREI